MKNEDVKAGMKVVPHSKTVEGWGSLNECVPWKQAAERKQPYLFVHGFENHVNTGTGLTQAWALGVEIDRNGSGYFFNASDFEPYQEPQPVTSYVVAGDFPTRITYRHDTYAEAEAEAKRLCLKEGKTFRVLKVVAAVEPAQPTVIRVEG